MSLGWSKFFKGGVLAKGKPGRKKIIKTRIPPIRMCNLRFSIPVFLKHFNLRYSSSSAPMLFDRVEGKPPPIFPKRNPPSWHSGGVLSNAPTENKY
jgi:hypothetical protein